MPAKETGFLSRIKVTVKFGFNMKSNLEMVEEDVTELVKYNYRLKVKINKSWALIFNVQCIGINGFTSPNNYSAGFYAKM